MAILRALWTEKLIFSPKTLRCSIDLTPKHSVYAMYTIWPIEYQWEWEWVQSSKAATRSLLLRTSVIVIGFFVFRFVFVGFVFLGLCLLLLCF